MKLEDVKQGEEYWVYRVGLPRHKAIVGSIEGPNSISLSNVDGYFSFCVHPRQLAPIKKKSSTLAFMYNVQRKMEDAGVIKPPKMGRSFWVSKRMSLIIDNPPPYTPKEYSDWIEVREVLR